MKFLRWTAVVVLSLMSLLNVGVLTDASNASSTADVLGVIGAVALGLFGFVAAYGFARREPWGRAAAMAAGVLNIIGGVIAMAVDAQGGIVGVVVGAIIVVLAFVATDTQVRHQSALG